MLYTAITDQVISGGKWGIALERVSHTIKLKIVTETTVRDQDLNLRDDRFLATGWSPGVGLDVSCSQR